MDFKSSPFWILGARPWTKRHELFELVEMAEMLGDSEKAKAAHQALTMPGSRLMAELRWFPGVELEMLQAIERSLNLKGHCLPGELPTGTELSPLVRFNLTLSGGCDAAGKDPASRLLNLNLLFARVCAQQVTEDINKDREGTGFEPVAEADVRDALVSYGREVALEIWQEIEKADGLPEQMLQVAGKLTENGGATSLIAEVFALYELSVADEATCCKEKLLIFQQDQRKYTAFPKWLRKGLRPMQEWNRLMKPVRLFASLRGVNHDPTDEISLIGREIAYRMITLPNYDLAILCDEIRMECFGDDPEIRKELESSIAQWKKLRMDMRMNAISIIIVAGIGLVLAIYGMING